MTRSDDIIFEVVEALAVAEGTTPQELEYSLSEYVDPNVLKNLVSSNMTGKLTFEVPDYEVTVTASSDILIDDVPVQHGSEPYQSDEHMTNWSDANAQLSKFFDNFPCTVYQSRNEPGWPIEFISEQCRELTGYDPNAFVIGGVDFGFDLIHPDDRKRVSQIVAQAVENEEPFSVVYRIQTADGTEKWVLEIGVGLFEEADPIPFIGALIDISSLESDSEMVREIVA